jgi:hypothetical protein
MSIVNGDGKSMWSPMTQQEELAIEGFRKAPADKLIQPVPLDAPWLDGVSFYGREKSGTPQSKG